MRTTFGIALLLFFLSFSIAAPFEDLYTNDANIAIKWARLHFEIMRNPECDLTPPMAGRALAVVQNTIYDTWSYFDSAAEPTIDYSLNKRSGSDSDIATAISVAGWRSILHVYKDMAVYHFAKTEADELLFEETGLTNPSSRNANSPEGIANIVADELMEFCDGDGANNYGTAPFTTPGTNGEVVYKDYTNYFPVNDPLVTASRTTVEECSRLKSINKWQPLTTPVNIDGTGSQTQVYYSPHMSNVRGFALTCSSEFRPRGPPVHGLNTEGRVSFKDQHDEVLEYSATLDDRGKIISEYWLPTLEFGNPPSHFMFFAMNALIEENRSLGDSVKLLMALANSQFDAGIAAWEAKRYFDSSRPITAIRCMYAGEEIDAWAGPYLGVQTVNAGDWLPYQPINFVSPPFSEYVSGHSTFAMAGAVVLEKFFGPRFVGPNSVTTLPGESVIEPIITDPSDPFYVEGVTDVPNEGFDTVGYSPRSTVVLSWDTWREAAEESGISRLYGGVHIQDGNEDGLDMGDKVGELVWDKAAALFAGESNSSSFSSNSFSESSSSSSASTLPVPILFLFIALICSLMKQ